jgi:RHS repeat-associated protein
MEKDDEVKGGGNSYTTEFRQYDARLGRWLRMDPLANEFAAWSAYNYVTCNPIILIDPDGKKPTDWFLNQKNGKLIYLKGKSTLTQKDLDKIGSNYKTSDYSNVGKDDMFGKSLPVSLSGFDGSNQLDKNHLIVDDCFAEILMQYVGYTKAKDITVEETETYTGGPKNDPFEVPHYSYSIKKIESTITYAKKANMNEKDIISDDKVAGQYNYFRTVTYKVTIPYNESYKNNTFFRDNQVSNSTNSVLKLVSSVIDVIF